ncbi:uncharacterized protein LOC119589841 isoform X2 [Penaeus monodon]|uniref:uncharacterized protein LOC119589841 isoform X2 n=1 Tax=Penaeus monodon TaxID=6687 RepID=UPI0018A72627|nr:uncharacterized protein LOC119589841 isoform X2 [Penaeus monodon]
MSEGRPKEGVKRRSEGDSRSRRRRDRSGESRLERGRSVEKAMDDGGGDRGRRDRADASGGERQERGGRTKGESEREVRASRGGRDSRTNDRDRSPGRRGGGASGGRQRRDESNAGSGRRRQDLRARGREASAMEGPSPRLRQAPRERRPLSAIFLGCVSPSGFEDQRFERRRSEDYARRHSVVCGEAGIPESGSSPRQEDSAVRKVHWIRSLSSSLIALGRRTPPGADVGVRRRSLVSGEEKLGGRNASGTNGDRLEARDGPQGLSGSHGALSPRHRSSPSTARTCTMGGGHGRSRRVSEGTGRSLSSIEESGRGCTRTQESSRSLASPDGGKRGERARASSQGGLSHTSSRTSGGSLTSSQSRASADDRESQGSGKGSGRSQGSNDRSGASDERGGRGRDSRSDAGERGRRRAFGEVRNRRRASSVGGGQGRSAADIDGRNYPASDGTDGVRAPGEGGARRRALSEGSRFDDEDSARRRISGEDAIRRGAAVASPSEDLPPERAPGPPTPSTHAAGHTPKLPLRRRRPVNKRRPHRARPRSCGDLEERVGRTGPPEDEAAKRKDGNARPPAVVQREARASRTARERPTSFSGEALAIPAFPQNALALHSHGAARERSFVTMLLQYFQWLQADAILNEDGSIYRRGARRWRKLYKVNGHIFQAKRFNRRAFCEFCKDRIWGLGRQGFKCTQCKLLVHKKCHKLQKVQCNADLDTSTDTLASHDSSTLPRGGTNGRMAVDYTADVSGPSSEPMTPTGSAGQYCLDDFELIRVIGRGSYAKVLMVELKRTKRIYAMKVIKKTLVTDDEDIDWVQTEKHVFETASNHPFLVGLHSCFQTPSRLFFVIEFVRGGDLMFHMQRQRRLPEEHARFYAAEICLALNFLHEKGIIYRDLKLDNVLLDHEGHIKLTDYGMCKEGIRPGDTTSTFCGTPNYIAPEILQGVEYSFSVDWWALGVLLYEMLAGKSPFDIVGASDNPDCNTEDFLFQVILERPIRIPRSLSVKAASILRGFLNKNPVDRLGCHPETGFTDIVTHPFFKTIDWEMLEQRQVPPPYRPRLDSDRDLANFPPEFTDEPIQLTPDDARAIENIDQSEFEGFEYVNPLLMSMEDCV